MVAELERRAIREALERAGGNQSQAARELGMTEQTLRYRLKKLNPDHPRQHSRTRKIRRTR
jgi:transcriptional regulator with GAF, ATPase, and Fis domain